MCIRDRCAVQHDQIRPLTDPYVPKSQLTQLPVNIPGHLRLYPCVVIDQRLNPLILIRVGAGIAMYGDKKIRPHLVRNPRLLTRTLGNILCPCIYHIYTVIFQDFSYGQGKIQRIRFFLPALVG